MADLGMAAKMRPVVLLLADDLDVPRTLLIYVPLTRQSRGSPLEVPLGHLPFLDEDSVANVQAIGSAPRVRFERRLGTLPPEDLAAIKSALAMACSL